MFPKTLKIKFYFRFTFYFKPFFSSIVDWNIKIIINKKDLCFVVRSGQKCLSHLQNYKTANQYLVDFWKWVFWKFWIYNEDLSNPFEFCLKWSGMFKLHFSSFISYWLAFIFLVIFCIYLPLAPIAENTTSNWPADVCAVLRQQCPVPQHRSQ